MPKRKYQTPEIMHDAPLTDHKAADFHFDDFAATFARLIANKETETPLAIGINGAWGSGKTSLLLRVKNMLDEPKRTTGAHRFAEGEESKFRNCKTVWFDAWKYSGEDQILAALLRVIVAEMQRDGFWNRLKSDLRVKKEELRWFDLLADSLIQFSSAGVYSLNLGDYRVDTPLKQASAFFDYFDDSLSKLLSSWAGENGALVVFIDDLDRCMPEKTVQVLEAIKLFLDKHGCVFVLGADIKIVQSAVETHYKNTGITGESAKDYLEKIIQIRFDLPPIVETAMQEYLRMQDKTKVDDAMLKRWKALVAAAEVNPRRVKNVINDLNLQWFMAVNSGQAEGVNRDDFICWQALMRAASSAFARQVLDFENKERRHSFVLDALKWQNGKQEEKDAVKGYFSAYEDKDAKRLRGVLQQISFSDEFTPEALDAMIYMAAPPPKPEPVKPPEESRSQKITSEKRVEVGVAYETDQALPVTPVLGQTLSEGNRLTIGGLEFVRVPAGKFVMGSKDDSEFQVENERPQHVVDIPYDYWVGKFIITNGQFGQFIKDTNYETTADKEGGLDPLEMIYVKGIHWKKPSVANTRREEKTNHPVVQVSWIDTSAYCKWFCETFKEELGNMFLRLPTEAEWEKSARGAYGNEWPWGNDFDIKKCNSYESSKGTTTSIGAYSSFGGDSPYGCADMAGNVWEWINSQYAKYPYDATDGREDVSGMNKRVLRGGSFYYARDGVRCAFRYAYSPDYRDNNIGFRVCVVPIPKL